MNDPALAALALTMGRLAETVGGRRSRIQLAHWCLLQKVEAGSHAKNSAAAADLRDSFDAIAHFLVPDIEHRQIRSEARPSGDDPRGAPDE